MKLTNAMDMPASPVNFSNLSDRALLRAVRGMMTGGAADTTPCRVRTADREMRTMVQIVVDRAAER